MPTPPEFSTGAVLTAAQMNQIGLWRVTPTGATNGTVNADGSVTIGNAVASVTVTGCFSSSFANYKVTIYGGVASNLSTITMQLGASATGYYSIVNYAGYATATTPASAGDNNANLWTYMGYGTTNFLQMNADIFNPFAAKYTTYGPANWAAGTVAGISSGVHAVATSYSSFTIAVTAGLTMTGGTIRVYGYN